MSLPGIDQLVLGAARARRREAAPGRGREASAERRRGAAAVGGDGREPARPGRGAAPADARHSSTAPSRCPSRSRQARRSSAPSAGRVELLPDEAKRALVVAAVALTHEVELQSIAAALATMGIEPSALEPAEDAGLIELDERRLSFRHPLVRSAVYHCAAPSERRAAHRALADTLGQLDDPERRAWHLAGAAIGRDDEAAAALEVLAERAVERSGYAAAAARSPVRQSSRRTSPRGSPAPGRRGGGAAGGGPRSRSPSLRAAGGLGSTTTGRRAASARPASTTSREAGAATRCCSRRRGCSRTSTGNARSRSSRRPASRSRSSATGRRCSPPRSMPRCSPRPAATSGRSAWPRSRAAGWSATRAGRRRAAALQEAARSQRLGSEIDPLELLRSAVTLDWLERSREAFRDAGEAIDRSRAEGAGGLLPYLLVQHAWHGVRAGSSTRGTQPRPRRSDWRGSSICGCRRCRRC